VSLTAVLTVLGLMGVGAALVLWPCVLLVSHAAERQALLAAEIVRLKKEMNALRLATDAVVGTEREIDHARDLPPLDELGVLLRDPAPPAAGDEAGAADGQRA
jgi:hypothetical protein